MSIKSLKLHWELSVVWILIIYFAFSALMAIVVYVNHGNPSSYVNLLEAVKTLFLFAGVGFVAFTAYFQWAQANFFVEIENQKLDLEKKKNAMLLFSFWDSEENRRIREFYRGMRAKHKTIGSAAFVELINKDAVAMNALIDMANFFEGVEQEIQYGIADEEVLKTGFKPLVSTIGEVFEPWFLSLKSSDSKYWDHFIPFFNLLAKWK